MSTQAMREALYNVPKYHGAEGWLRKVDNMSADQILAVYLRFQRAGLLPRR